MKGRILAAIILMAMLAGGCYASDGGAGPAGSPEASALASPADEPEEEVIVEAREGDFVLQLAAGRKTYAADEPVELKIRLKYAGEQKRVRISHAASPFFFFITELSRDMEIGYVMNQPLIYQEMKRGEWLEETYTKTGGYAEEGPHRAFIEQFMEGESFPEGRYSIVGEAEFTFHNDDSGSPDGKETKYAIRTEPILVESINHQ